jgi:N-acetylglucosaminyl-diphospho-decaprenol L-rhamnosyltransferase
MNNLSRKIIPLSIIIVTYKSNKFFEKCLLSIINGTVLAKEIIIIDNNSPRPPNYIVNKFLRGKTNIIYKQNKDNYGFAKAANQGAEIASSKYLLFLNPDLYLSKYALQEIWNYAQYDNNIVGGKVVEINGLKTKKTVSNIPSLKTILIEFTSLRKILDKNNINKSNFWDNFAMSSRTVTQVKSLSGCLFALKKKDFLKIGKFDERYFMYLEDLDFFMRAKLLNYNPIYIPRILGEHFEGGSSRSSVHKINELAWNKSKRAFVKKHFNKIGLLLIILFYLDDKLITLYKAIKEK